MSKSEQLASAWAETAKAHGARSCVIKIRDDVAADPSSFQDFQIALRKLAEEYFLTEEQKELCRLAHAFAEREIRPREPAHDAEQRHPAELIAHAHKLGLMNLHVPAEYGGLGLSAFDGMLVGEEINWGCTGIGTSILANGLGSAPVILFGSQYWGGMVSWLSDVILKAKNIADDDVRLLHLTDSPSEVVDIVVRSQDALRRMQVASDDI